MFLGRKVLQALYEGIALTLVGCRTPYHSSSADGIWESQGHTMVAQVVQELRRSVKVIENCSSYAENRM